MTKFYFLGPEGSNTHVAAEKFNIALNKEAQLISVHNINQGFNNFLNDKEGSYLILPLENSIEGTVRETIDNLIQNDDNSLKIYGELTLDIEHCLLVNKNSGLSDIDTVISHPQAISQCIERINDLLGSDVKIISESSTSNATKKLSSLGNNFASIANPLCARIYDKKILNNNMSNVHNNKTRFVIISKSDDISSYKTPVRTAITFSTKNIAGALASVLDVLAYYGINLSHIDSRPSKVKLGEYIFYCELDTTFENNNLEIALNKIKNYTNYLKICGEFFSI